MFPTHSPESTTLPLTVSSDCFKLVTTTALKENFCII